jgi:hypothetical protein
MLDHTLMIENNSFEKTPEAPDITKQNVTA